MPKDISDKISNVPLVAIKYYYTTENLNNYR